MSEHLNAYQQPVGFPLPQWQPRPLPQSITLTGQYCQLEPFNAAAHGAALYRAYARATDARDWTYLFCGPFATEAHYLEYADSMARSRDPLHFTVVDRHSGAPLGTLALMRIDAQNGVIEVGHVAFSPQLKRSRLSTEAHFLLMRYAFEQLGYRRYEWKCDSCNLPSRQAAQRLGFEFEGIFRQAVVYKGRSRDTAWFSIIDREWPARKAGFERWLAAENFRADGQQIASLDRRHPR